jgi:hypothetical protein
MVCALLGSAEEVLSVGARHGDGRQNCSTWKDWPSRQWLRVACVVCSAPPNCSTWNNFWGLAGTGKGFAWRLSRVAVAQIVPRGTIAASVTGVGGDLRSISTDRSGRDGRTATMAQRFIDRSAQSSANSLWINANIGGGRGVSFSRYRPVRCLTFRTSYHSIMRQGWEILRKLKGLIWRPRNDQGWRLRWLPFH